MAEVLERPAVDLHEDFFALGGDSLRAVQIVLRLNEELETEVPINALFETRTVYGLAMLLSRESRRSHSRCRSAAARGSRRPSGAVAHGSGRRRTAPPTTRRWSSACRARSTSPPRGGADRAAGRHAILRTRYEPTTPGSRPRRAAGGTRYG